MRGALGVLEAAPNSHPSCCLCRSAQARLSPPRSADHGQFRLAYEVSRGLPRPLLFGVQWGAAQTPHWEGCCSLTRKKKKRQG